MCAFKRLLQREVPALLGFMLLVAACVALPTPTVPVDPSMAPSATASGSAVPTVSTPETPLPTRHFSLPTWTPRPTSTAAATSIPTAPWPTAQPTPTPASALFPSAQVATYFFYWYDCPGSNCDPSVFYNLPPGLRTPLDGDPDSTDGLLYSGSNVYWNFQELRDMRLAGIDVVLPVDWGDTPMPWFQTSTLQALVEANRQMDPPLKIGLFDDDTSESAEYRDYMDNQRFDGSTYIGDEPLDLENHVAGYLFYDRKIKPFFLLIPQDMWATHNGLPVEEGGRPIIVVYMTYNIIHMEKAGALWRTVKDAFARDFQDKNGQPIQPWVILDESWFTLEARMGLPSIEEVADGRYVWGSALLGPQIREWHGYKTAAAGPGFDDLLLHGDAGRVQPHDSTPDGTRGDAGTFLRWSISQVPVDTNLILVETWNELWEGTSVCRADYPAIAGRKVSEDFFLDQLRRLFRGQGLWWSAKPRIPSWPTELALGRSYNLQLTMVNNGARTWTPDSGEKLILGGDFFPKGAKIRPSAPVRPGLPGTFTIRLDSPQQSGTYTVTWQMASVEGFFGPQAYWSFRVVESAPVSSLRVLAPSGPLQVGVPLTLTAELDPAADIQAARMQVRFDPGAVTLAGMQPLRGRRPSHWSLEVDAESGLATFEEEFPEGKPVWALALLQLIPLSSGSQGVWIEQVELAMTDGSTVILPAQWVALEIK